jgi:beta-lactamase regulating signal transducer with metallopeptidase domain
MNGTGSPFAVWLLHSAAGGGLLLLLAWPLTRLCRQPAWRQRLGESALLAALLLCALNLGPSWITLPVLGTESSSLPIPAAPTRSPELPSALAAEPEHADPSLFDNASATFVTPAADTGVGPISADVMQPITRPESQERDLSSGIASRLATFVRSRWLTWTVLAYAVVSVCLLGRWLLGHLVLWRLLRASQPAPEAMNQVFQTMTGRQRRRPRLLVSRRLSVPLSCGLLRPCVIVPASLCDPNAVRTLRWVFAHELTHTGRGDAWSCLLFGLGQALYFCFPWFWWLRRQVRLCQEYIADAAAAEQAADPEDYAQFLVSLTGAPVIPLGALGVFENSSDLLRRVTMLVQSPIRVEQRCPGWWSLLTAGSLLGLALLVSGISLRAADAPKPADQNSGTAATDQQEASKPSPKAEQTEPAESQPLRLKVVPDPKPATKPVPEKKIQFQARSMPWPMALEWLANQADMPISASVKPEGNFEYIQPKGRKQPFTIPEVVDIMNAQLMALPKPCILIRGRREFSLFPLPTKRGTRIDPSKLPLVTIAELGQHGQTEIVSLEYHLDVLHADAIATELQRKNILSPFGEAMALPGSNQLVLRDTVQNLRNIVHFLREAEDAEKKRGSGISYTCEYIKASDAERILRDLLGVGSAPAQAQPGPQPNLSCAPAGDPQQKKSVNISYDETSNRVFVTGSPNKLEIAREILKKLDVPQPGQPKIRIGRPALQRLPAPGGDAQELAKALQEMHKSPNTMTKLIALNKLDANDALANLHARFETKGNAFVPSLSADIGRNAIIVKGTSEQIQAVEDALAELGEKPTSGGEHMNTRIITLGNWAATPQAAVSLAQTLAHMLPQLRKNPVYLILPQSAEQQVPSQNAGSPKLPGNSRGLITLKLLGNKLIVTSDDPQAISLVQDLSRLLTATWPGEGNLEIFRLKHAKASDVVKRIDVLFSNSKANPNGIRVVADPTTNALIVRANPHNMEQVRGLVEKLIDIEPQGNDRMLGHASHLGIQVRKPDPALADQLDLPKGQGLLIEHLVPGSPAAKGGLKPHDILLELDGKPVPDSAADVVGMLEQGVSNNAVVVTVLRKGKRLQLRLPLTSSLTHAQTPDSGGPANRTAITTLLRTPDGFSARYQEGRLLITVAGSLTKIRDIQIRDAGKSVTYQSLDQVPAPYRGKVQNLIEMSEQNNRKNTVGEN